MVPTAMRDPSGYEAANLPGYFQRSFIEYSGSTLLALFLEGLSWTRPRAGLRPRAPGPVAPQRTRSFYIRRFKVELMQLEPGFECVRALSDQHARPTLLLRSNHGQGRSAPGTAVRQRVRSEQYPARIWGCIW